jgi:hypothetical protein
MLQSFEKRKNSMAASVPVDRDQQGIKVKYVSRNLMDIDDLIYNE